MENISKSKGITLIALIVTIIVLLILAGISINTLFGENGLFDKAKQTEFLTEYNSILEDVSLYNVNSQIKKYTKSETSQEVFPLGQRVSTEEQEQWKKDKTELIDQIQEKTEKDITDTSLYWIDFEKLNYKPKHKYVIDTSTGLIFCYEGHFYSKNTHHIPHNVEKNSEINIKPEFSDGSQYPILTSDGIKKAGTVNIKFSNAPNYKNYYSLDNGTTWQEYKEEFTVDKDTTVHAKSLNTTTGVEIIVSKDITISKRAITEKAYDGSLDTYDNAGTISYGYKYMYVDESAIGSFIKAHIGWQYAQIRLLDENEDVLYESDIPGVSSGKKTVEFEILKGTKYLVLYCSSKSGDGALLYEMEVNGNIKINSKYTRIFPEVTSKGIVKPYTMINLEIANRDEIEKTIYSKDNKIWNEYKKGEEIRLELGETIYAKNQLKGGRESKVFSQECALDSRGIAEIAYDGSQETYDDSGPSGKGYKYMHVDESAIGSTIKADIGYKYAQIRLLDENEQVLYKSETPGVSYGKKTVEFKILEGTKYIALYCSSGNGDGALLYEIKLEPVPQIKSNPKRIFSKITSTGIVKPTHSMITLSVPNKDIVEKILYSKDNQTWNEYKGEEIRLELGETIYAKNQLKDGKESETVTQQCVQDDRGITEAAYDGSQETYDNSGPTSKGYKYMYVDESAIGSTVKADISYKYAQIRLLDKNEQVLYKSETPGVSYGKKTVEFKILEGTKYIALYCSSSNGDGALLHEINILN